MTRVFGITGWKNSGKTTLTEKLVPSSRGAASRVSTVKQRTMISTSTARAPTAIAIGSPVRRK